MHTIFRADATGFESPWKPFILLCFAFLLIIMAVVEVQGATLKNHTLEHIQILCGGDCPSFPQENGTVPLGSSLQ